MCELDSGSCSARLQAGIFLIPECPPEGGRYKNAAILSLHTDSLGPVREFNRAHRASSLFRAIPREWKSQTLNI